ncbi:MAG: winged helix-turn-helix domain-containing protein [Lautropia sp.]|nr:winged helix-turn-helix domain-containing protein [Lautropia sp.]
MKTHGQAVFRFGHFVLVPGERLLLLDGTPIAMTGKAFDLLATLVQNAGHLVTKDELLHAVWPGVVVEEVNLSVNISVLRKVLSAAPDGANGIETVPRQGYRFNAAVEVGDLAAIDLGALREVLPYLSVAVLPFSIDQAPNSYLADGLVEGVINDLTRLRALRVTPRASAFRFKDAPGDPIAAGRELDVAAVVTGALSQRGNGVRLQLELVDVARNAQVWSAAYDVAAADLAQLQVRLIHDLAGAMHIRLSGAEVAGLARRPTTHEQAYQAYLQGRYLWNQRSETSLQGAIALFHNAIDLDPHFALTFAGLADAHTTLGYLGYCAPVGAFPVARSYALKALELDPSLAQAHASLAYIKFYFDWDWDGARQAFLRAIELNPNDPVSHQWYAVYLLASGRPDHAFIEAQRAHQLDPLSLAVNTDIGFHHYYNGRYAEAVSQLQSVLGMKRDFLLAHLWLARTLLEMGRFDEALAETSIAEGKAREWSVLVAARGHTYAMAGMTDQARAVLREMALLSRHRFVTSYGIALVHAGLGRKDEAFRWLDRAFEERSHWLVWLRLDPRWKNLRDDPRFETLIKRIKYPA